MGNVKIPNNFPRLGHKPSFGDEKRHISDAMDLIFRSTFYAGMETLMAEILIQLEDGHFLPAQEAAIRAFLRPFANQVFKSAYDAELDPEKPPFKVWLRLHLSGPTFIARI